MAATMKNIVYWDVTSYVIVFLRSALRLLVTVNVTSSPILVTPDDGGAKFLRNVGSYKSRTS
jgi:hypothetical protein